MECRGEVQGCTAQEHVAWGCTQGVYEVLLCTVLESEVWECTEECREEAPQLLLDGVILQKKEVELI